MAAAAAGKMVLCEKPLSMNLVEGQTMVDAVEKAGVPNTVWYNYRRVPAVTLAKQLIDEGRLGKIFHYRANFLQDWTISADLPQGGTGLWRLDVAAAGSGVTGDLLAHCIDTALWLNGSISSVSAMTETFVKERKHNLTGKVEPVGIDDACAFLCRFDNGSLGLFESTRYARGHKALYTFEVNGEKASLKWDLHDLHRLQLLRPPRRFAGSRLAQRARHRRRHALHEALVGVRACKSATSTRSCTRWPTSSKTWPRASRPRRRFATPWRRRPSATPCSTRPSTTSGSRSCPCKEQATWRIQQAYHLAASRDFISRRGCCSSRASPWAWVSSRG